MVSGDKAVVVLCLGVLLLALGGCDDGATSDPPKIYTFESRSGDGSSVSYSGQVLRQVLIVDLVTHIAGLTARIDNEGFFPEQGDVLEELDFYYAFDSQSSGDRPLYISTEPSTLQHVYGDIATDKDLQGKIAGNDPEGQHKDFRTQFRGWDEAGVSSPDSLVHRWFEQLEALARERANGNAGTDPDGEPLKHVHVTEKGLDLQQLIQKFLGVAVCFSQGVDDYLDNDVPDGGINSDHTELEEGEPYTELEHAWDEAYGYFGAARDYTQYSDEEIAGSGGRDSHRNGYSDSNDDGHIDLTSEYNFGHSTNAAKRDLGAEGSIDFTQEAFDALLRGRHVLAHATGALNEAEKGSLVAERDIIVSVWEKIIAATVVHYINEVLIDMKTFGTAGYDFYAHAKHWSEMKGFALGFQFSPRSPLSDAEFLELHHYLGQAPVLPGQEGVTAYEDGLRISRAVLVQAYNFDPANEGGVDGQGGW
ncbi:MAG: DUF4856 domain-containing protein [Myxococcales bacterium]|nr:DUF4856 domain-containing protein [Myxococcales bacterium]MCB9708251.1 DUF4856 domain-containing protein [Myxococcales bacterium]